jgi:hypothetical protein
MRVIDITDSCNAISRAALNGLSAMRITIALEAARHGLTYTEMFNAHEWTMHTRGAA